MIYAKVIADSTYLGDRLITIEVQFHRFILPELNTHRSFSRNYQSSRAIPIANTIEQVRTNPARPVHLGKNQSGMVADSQLDEHLIADALNQWDNAAANAADMATKMMELGLHKQVVNRVLEPFVYTKGIITASYDAWMAFMDLRLHKDAQPEIQALAYKINEAIKESLPVELQEGFYHLPYVNWKTVLGKQVFDDPQLKFLNDAIQVSTSSCAQVSYRKLDTSLAKAKQVYAMLNLPSFATQGIPSDPPHFSPAEHVAEACKNKNNSGNFALRNFEQYRKRLESYL